MEKEELLQIIKEEGDEMDFKYLGLPCLIKRNTSLGHWCGYVQVPKDSRLFGKSYYIDSQSELGISKLEQAINGISVHEGLTFSGDIKDDGNYWFGFDCGHYDDLSLYQLDYPKLGQGIYRTKDFVITECENLAKQLKEIIELKL